MAQILVRDLDPDVVSRLKDRAKRHGRSLQSEAKSILTQAAGMSFAEAVRRSGQWQKELEGLEIPDSAGLIREDRER